MERFLLFFCAIIAVSAFSSDPVIRKLVPDGPRFMYADGEDGQARLVDSWVKVSDLRNMARFNPDVDNQYHLFTRANPSRSQVLVFGREDLIDDSNFDPQKRVVVLIHGFMGSATAGSNVAMVPAFLHGEDLNIIVVDWSRGSHWGLNGIPVGRSIARFLNWLNSVTGVTAAQYHIAGFSVGGHTAGIVARHMDGDVPYVTGRSIARFLNWLNSVTGVTAAQYHIAGFSVGGHTAGIVARHMDGDVPYVTALDPASRWQIDEVVSPADALYTEVIHTSAGVNGWGDPLGHVDFYPNGGRNMPGCFVSVICDHQMSYEYFAESVAIGGFNNAVQCRNRAEASIGSCTLTGRLNMGGLTPKIGASGIYFLRTNRRSPYSFA